MLKSQEKPLASSNQQFSVKTKGRNVPVCSPVGCKLQEPEHKLQPAFFLLPPFLLTRLPQTQPSPKGTSVVPSLDSKVQGLHERLSPSPLGLQGSGSAGEQVVPTPSPSKSLLCFTHTWAIATSLALPGLDGKGLLSTSLIGLKQGQTGPDPIESEEEILKSLRGPERLRDLPRVTQQVDGRAEEGPGAGFSNLLCTGLH